MKIYSYALLCLHVSAKLQIDSDGCDSTEQVRPVRPVSPARGLGGMPLTLTENDYLQIIHIWTQNQFNVCSQWDDKQHRCWHGYGIQLIQKYTKKKPWNKTMKQHCTIGRCETQNVSFVSRINDWWYLFDWYESFYHAFIPVSADLGYIAFYPEMFDQLFSLSGYFFHRPRPLILKTVIATQGLGLTWLFEWALFMLNLILDQGEAPLQEGKSIIPSSWAKKKYTVVVWWGYSHEHPVCL